MSKTLQELKQAALDIKRSTAPESITAPQLGQLLDDIIEYAYTADESTINELKEVVQGLIEKTGRNVVVFVAETNEGSGLSYGLGGGNEALRVMGSGGIRTFTGKTGNVPALIIDGSLIQTGASPEQISAAIKKWLDEHPEATTTVADGSITLVKLSTDLQNAIKEGGTAIDSMSGGFILSEVAAGLKLAFGLDLNKEDGTVITDWRDDIIIPFATHLKGGAMSSQHVIDLENAQQDIEEVLKPGLESAVRDLTEVKGKVGAMPSSEELNSKVQQATDAASSASATKSAIDSTLAQIASEGEDATIVALATKTEIEAESSFKAVSLIKDKRNILRYIQKKEHYSAIFNFSAFIGGVSSGEDTYELIFEFDGVEHSAGTYTINGSTLYATLIASIYQHFVENPVAGWDVKHITSVEDVDYNPVYADVVKISEGYILFTKQSTEDGSMKAYFKGKSEASVFEFELSSEKGYTSQYSEGNTLLSVSDTINTGITRYLMPAYTTLDDIKEQIAGLQYPAAKTYPYQYRKEINGNTIRVSRDASIGRGVVKMNAQGSYFNNEPSISLASKISADISISKTTIKAGGYACRRIPQLIEFPRLETEEHILHYVGGNRNDRSSWKEYPANIWTGTRGAVTLDISKGQRYFINIPQTSLNSNYATIAYYDREGNIFGSAVALSTSPFKTPFYTTFDVNPSRAKVRDGWYMLYGSNIGLDHIIVTFNEMMELYCTEENAEKYGLPMPIILAEDDFNELTGGVEKIGIETENPYTRYFWYNHFLKSVFDKNIYSKVIFIGLPRTYGYLKGSTTPVMATGNENIVKMARTIAHYWQCPFIDTTRLWMSTNKYIDALGSKLADKVHCATSNAPVRIFVRLNGSATAGTIAIGTSSWTNASSVTITQGMSKADVLTAILNSISLKSTKMQKSIDEENDAVVLSLFGTSVAQTTDAPAITSTSNVEVVVRGEDNVTDYTINYLCGQLSAICGNLEGKKVLWVGSSYPKGYTYTASRGVSYPVEVGRILGCNVQNASKEGSMISLYNYALNGTDVADRNVAEGTDVGQNATSWCKTSTPTTDFIRLQGILNLINSVDAPDYIIVDVDGNEQNLENYYEFEKLEFDE